MSGLVKGIFPLYREPAWSESTVLGETGMAGILPRRGRARDLVHWLEKSKLA